MVTLEKIAGYDNSADLVDKIAEAMDFLEANNVDAIGGLTALMNVDEYGNTADEKVASELSYLDGQQIEALNQTADYLAGEDPEAIAKIALDLNDEASVMDKVAETMDYLDAYGIDPESAFVIAANVTPEGNIVDEKVASDIVAGGFTDADFEKIAEAIEYLGANNIGFDEAFDTMAFIKEAAPSAENLEAADNLLSSVGGAIKRRVKGAWNGYKAAITGKGIDKVQARIDGRADKLKKINETVDRTSHVKSGYGTQGGTANKAHSKSLAIKNRLDAANAADLEAINQIKGKQLKTIAGTALGAGALGAGAYYKVKN